MVTHPTVTIDRRIRKKLGPDAIAKGKLKIHGGTKIARRFKEITSQVIVDQGGIELCSEARQQLIRRLAAACVLAEALENKMAEGATIRIDEHSLLTKTLVKTAKLIGINRRSRNVTPTLHDYLNQTIEDDPTIIEQDDAEQDEVAS